MPTPKTSSLIEVSWTAITGERTNTNITKISDNYYVAILPDTETVRTQSGFTEATWSAGVSETLTSLPFSCRMGQLKTAGGMNCILINLDRLHSRADEILAAWGGSAGGRDVFGQTPAIEPTLFAYGAAVTIERLYNVLHRPRGIDTTVKCNDWNTMPATLYLKAHCPEIGATFSSAATAPKPTPTLLTLDVQPTFPAELKDLETLLKDNLWWSWHAEGVRLLSDLDPALWLSSGQDPVAFLRALSPEKLAAAARSQVYLERLKHVSSKHREYLAAKKPSEIAYFCMEYGLSASLRFYSGGLGILAGDHLKTASDLNIPLCALGLAYRQGYFRQVIDAEGAQEARYQFTDFEKTYAISAVNDAKGKRVRVTVDVPSGTVHVQAWRVSVGRVDLYLLDTDFDENTPAHRRISDRLYGGDNDHRLIQEWVLSAGGLKLLETLGVTPKIFHMNEGHTSFLNLLRLTELVTKDKLSFSDAIEFLRHSTIFTTHTPVPAGHDRFGATALRPYIKPLADKLSMDVDALHSLGLDPDRPDSTAFSTTAMCIRTSERVNGVSAIHGEVSRRMFRPYFPGYGVEELPVTSITNGVHPGTWIAPEFQELFRDHVGDDWRKHLADKGWWQRFLNVDPRLVWNTHVVLKQQLITWLKEHLTATWTDRQTDLAKALAALDCNPFIATYARRFATYKRPALILKDLERLRRIFNAKVPVIFIFAGKAHPMDKPGKDVIREVNEISRLPEFAGRILFIENYDMDKGAKLVRGSDIWINNPTRPLEASGTSGMKAAMNGCLNLSVPDGWWAEGYNGKNGWVIGEASLDQTAEFQAAFDSTQIYMRLEQEVIPCFEQRNAEGIPLAWVEMMKESIATLTPEFSTDRMLTDYRTKFYEPAIHDAEALRASHFAKLKEFGTTRKQLSDSWSAVEVLAVQTAPKDAASVESQQGLGVSVKIRHPRIAAQNLVVQALIAPQGARKTAKPFRTVTLTPAATSGDSTEWKGTLTWDLPGTTTIGVRVSPKNLVSQTQEPDYDMNLVRWM